MHNHEFVIWLDGFRSIVAARAIDRKQCFIIRNHLNLVKAVTGELGVRNRIVFGLVSVYRESRAGTHATGTLFKIVPAVGRLDNETELAYWLQGSIEIGGLKAYSAGQCEHIVRKIGEMREKKDLAAFVIESMDRMLGFPEDAGEHFQMLADHLNRRFKHDIDPGYAGDQELFGAIHRGAVEA